MAGLPPSHRLYSDQEVGALIKRASELQEAARQSRDHSLTLPEIEHLATEIGVEPQFLQAAAAELVAHPESRSGFNLAGGPFTSEHKRVLAGAITEAQWEEIVLALRSHTGAAGQTGRLGQAYEWTHDLDELATTQVTVRPQGDRTAVRVHKQFLGFALLAYALTLFVSLVGTGIALDGSGVSAPVGLGLLVGGGTTGLALMRLAIGRWTALQRRKLRQLTDALCQTIGQLQAETAEPAALETGETSEGKARAILREPSAIRPGSS